MKSYDDTLRLKAMIQQGEHATQDFKFEISDCRKIARSISAFANTDGGRLLIGVKDNGHIAGIRSEEEIYMIEAAAKMYCTPGQQPDMEILTSENKKVLIATISKAETPPVCAIDENKRPMAYVRIKDENILASAVRMAVWEQERAKEGHMVRLLETESTLIGMADSGRMFTLNEFAIKASISRRKAIKTLASFIRYGIVEEVFENHRFYFRKSRKDRP